MVQLNEAVEEPIHLTIEKSLEPLSYASRMSSKLARLSSDMASS